jgi:tetratricopeptide (TPR) repeat protein
MGKDSKIVAKNQLVKAQQLFKARQFKKSGKNYHLAGNTFLKLQNYDQAKSCFLYAVRCFLELGKYSTVIELFRQAGEALLLNDDYIQANEIYREVINHIPNLKSSGDRNNNYILFSTLSYLCTYVKGAPGDGLGYIKRLRTKIDNEFFKESPLIKLITELTLTLRDNTKKYLDKIKNNIGTYKFRNSEINLLKLVLLLTDIKLSADFKITLDKDVYTTKEHIELKLMFNTKQLPVIINDSFYSFDLKKFDITKIQVNLSDNLTTGSKPNMPFNIKIGETIDLLFTLKPHFQIDETKIGPIVLTGELNENLILDLETSSTIPNLISPPATLETSIKNLRPPLIDQTFPLEILIENLSDGEALDVKINAEFPEQLKVMRGTTNKQIYSLRKNENLTWELNIKPIEAGDYIIKLDIKFKDTDQNTMEEIKEFPFSVKL